MLTLEVLGTTAFVLLLIGACVASAETARAEQRLRRLERRDPATAAAVRRARAATDYARGGLFWPDAFAMVCTPSRRSLHIGGDLDEEPAPVRAVTTPAERLAVATLSSDAASRTPPGDRRDAASARLSRRAVRTAQATMRQRAGIR